MRAHSARTARSWSAPRSSRRRSSGPAPRASRRYSSCASTLTPSPRRRRSRRSARRRSSQGDELGIVLVRALELQEIVIAAVRAVGIFAADRGTRPVCRAAARLLVEQDAHRIEDPVLAVAEQPHFLCRVAPGEAFFGLLVAEAEVPRQALDVARRHFDLGIAAAVGRALGARILHAHRDREGFFHFCIFSLNPFRSRFRFTLYNRGAWRPRTNSSCSPIGMGTPRPSKRSIYGTAGSSSASCCAA